LQKLTLSEDLRQEETNVVNLNSKKGERKKNEKEREKDCKTLKKWNSRRFHTNKRR